MDIPRAGRGGGDDVDVPRARRGDGDDADIPRAGRGGGDDADIPRVGRGAGAPPMVALEWTSLPPTLTSKLPVLPSSFWGVIAMSSPNSALITSDSFVLYFPYPPARSVAFARAYRSRSSRVRTGRVRRASRRSPCASRDWTIRVVGSAVAPRTADLTSAVATAAPPRQKRAAASARQVSVVARLPASSLVYWSRLDERPPRRIMAARGLDASSRRARGFSWQRARRLTTLKAGTTMFQALV